MVKYFKFAPLPTSFMAFAMLGFLISVILKPINPSYTFAFALLFALMFVASMVSMVSANPDEQLFPRPEPEINLNITNPFDKPKKKAAKKKQAKPTKKKKAKKKRKK